jgi:hypothetical protein
MKDAAYMASSSAFVTHGCRGNDARNDGFLSRAGAAHGRPFCCARSARPAALTTPGRRPVASRR